MRCRAKVLEAAMTTLTRLRLPSTCCLSDMSLALLSPALSRRRHHCPSLPISRWPHLSSKTRAQHTASSSQQTTDLNVEDWDDRNLSQEVLGLGDSGTAVAAKEETASVSVSDDEWYRIQAEDDDWFRKEEQFYEARVSEQEEWARPHIARPEAQPDYLRLSESSLFSQCRMDTFRASGPGGQHRNKTDSGVRLTHLPTGAVAQAVDDRSQHKNRAVAMSRLRILIASKVRRPVKLQGYKPPPELLRLLPPEPGKKASGDKIGVNHPDFAKGIQALLDLLSASKGYVFYAATLLRVSPNVLSKILTMDKTVLQATNELLISKGQKPFK